MRELVLRTGIALRRQLIEAERSNDEGLIAHARLTATLLEARLKLGLRAQAKRDLVVEAGQMMTLLFHQRDRQLDFHARFSNLATEMGLTPEMIGDGGDKAGLNREPELATDIRLVAG